MTNQSDKPLSIYLHIPFCSTKCTYCAFNTYVNLEALVEPFTFALADEITYVGRQVPKQKVGTIFFGGGTPSLLTPQQLEHLLTAIHTSFDVLPDAEISLEANPVRLTREYLTDLHGLGIHRLSIGMQSANANELQLFARHHDNDDVARAVMAARAAGYDNLNLDLIYGIPHQTLDHWQNTLTQMHALQPEHVSLYALGIEDGTSMKAWVDRGRLPLPDDDLTADMYELATDFLGAQGYAQYEISNWTREGFECRHNLQYWLNDPYIGLGPGAHGFAGGIRYAVMLSPHRYIDAIRKGVDGLEYPLTPAVDQWERLDLEGEIAETLMMTLRLTNRGVLRDEFAERFGVDLLSLHGETIERFVNYGLLEVTDARVRLTQRGRLLSNSVFRELI